MPDWASLAGPVLGAFLNKKGSTDAQGQFLEQQFQHADKWNQAGLDFARRQSTHAIRQRVADAQAAGLHPLYALGASASSSPMFTAGGGGVSGGQGYDHSSGSGLASGIQNAVSGIYNERKEKKRTAVLDARAERLLDAQVAQMGASALRDNAAAMESASRIKRAEQGALSGIKGDLVAPGIPAPALGDRKTRVHPNQSMPFRIETIDDKGRKIRTINPATGADEVLQGDLLGQLMGRFVTGPFRDWLFQARRTKKNPKRYYGGKKYDRRSTNPYGLRRAP